MRHDPERAYTFARGPNEQLWTDPTGMDLQASISGNERNHVFLARADDTYSDISLLSGFDDPGDGRVMTALDYDRDGWLDLAVANANAPRFQLYRNQIGGPTGDSRPTPAVASNVVAFRFVGGNHEARPSVEWSARDAYGARVMVRVGEVTLLREHRAGEGFAGQNSATLLVGLGDADRAEASVRFPSGRTVEVASFSPGSQITVYEREADSPTGRAVVVAPYRTNEDVSAGGVTGDNRRSSLEGRASDAMATVVAELDEASSPRLRVFTTMATWCPSCRAELPHVARLRQAFTSDDVGLYGVPVDPADTVAKLVAYVEELQPAYRLLNNLDPSRAAGVKAVALAAFPRDVLPTTIITNAEGNVLQVIAGTPMISDLKRMLADFAITSGER